jgi:hypothetical protein
VSKGKTVSQPTNTLQVRIAITAILQNPPGVYEDETTIAVPADIVDDPRFRESACSQVIAAQVARGALYRKIDEDTVEGIPMARVLNITAKMDRVSRIGLAL